MKVLITGGAGFLGQRLARQLLAQGQLTDSHGQLQTISELVLVDVVAAHDFNDARVKVVTGDIADGALMRATLDAQTASIFHLAAIVSGQAEADFELGMRINLDASRLLLDICRELGHKPKVVFTSSVAVYGGRLPDVVQDTTALNPQSSYGAQKAIGELLLNDYSRRGFVDGRVLRLPTISVRPGKPNKAASTFFSSIIREPLVGLPAVCPVRPDTQVYLTSPRRIIESMLLGMTLSPETLGNQRIIPLPGVTTTVHDMVSALQRVAGEQVTKLIRWEPDATIQRIVESWPSKVEAPRARALGFTADADFDAIVRAHIEDTAV